MARNKMGLGPLSTAMRITQNQPSEDQGKNLLHSTYEGNDRATMTWIIAIVASLSFAMIAISGVIFYKRKWSINNKPSGYLAASTSEDFHCHLQNCNGPILRVVDPSSKDPSLWIDRRWNTGDYEKDSNSSEKKLLGNHQHQHQGSYHHHHSNSNSDTEYAYVDRHNISSFTNRSSGSEGKQQVHVKKAESPEPYATTDIFKKDGKFPGRHYASPFVFPQNASIMKPRTIQSCDDLTENPKLMQHQVYQSRPNTKNTKSKKPKNLLDILPPPPVHPPPPPTNVYGLSQESVISPKYLFSHPIYQSTDRKFPQVSDHNRYYRVCPVDQRHYEKPITSSGDSGFKRVIQLSAKGSQPPCQVTQDFDKDFQNELQNFNEVVTQFSDVKCNNNQMEEFYSDQSSSDTSSCDISKSPSGMRDDL